MDGDAEEEADDLRSVPLTDLFLALGACFLFALFLAHPSLRFAATTPDDPTADLLAGKVQVRGAVPLFLFAARTGVRANDDTEISLEELARGGGSLIDRLANARDAAGGILLVILPGGEEAAFLLDPILSANLGGGTIHEIRLDEFCSALEVSAGNPARARCARTLAEAHAR